MTLIEEFRALRADLFTEFEAAPAVVTRTVKGTYDPVEDRATGDQTERRTGKGILGTSKIEVAGGVTQTVASVTIDIEVRTGDRVKIGKRTATVTSVKPLSPDGNKPILWRATLG